MALHIGIGNFAGMSFILFRTFRVGARFWGNTNPSLGADWNIPESVVGNTLYIDLLMVLAGAIASNIYRTQDSPRFILGRK